MTGKVIRLPAAHDAAAQRLIVRQAFAAVRRGDFEADVVHQVLRGRAGTPAELREAPDREAMMSPLLQRLRKRWPHLPYNDSRADPRAEP